MSNSDGNAAIPRLSCNCNRKKFFRVIALRSCRKKEDGCQDSKRERERERASSLGGEARTEMTALGWIDFHTRPCNNAVVANASTSTSALDCALFSPPICIPQSENSFRSKLFTSRRRPVVMESLETTEFTFSLHHPLPSFPPT